jgi:glycine/D-amino acid oxidase-like deaminating enzyme
MKVVVVGGGFYGCSLAIHFAKKGADVTLLEKNSDIMQMASYNNQARVHGGYHYPRSFLTARRSRENYSLFSDAYKPAIESSFKKLYVIAKKFSHINKGQFFNFCKKVEAPIELAPPAVKALFNSDLVEEVYGVEEMAFNAEILKAICITEIQKLKVKVKTDTKVEGIFAGNDSKLQARTSSETFEADQIYIAAYSATNRILFDSKLPLVPLKHEWTEMALIEPPSVLKNYGITLMDGPFWSMMPFPSTAWHTLSHVRYTPHSNWQDTLTKFADVQPGELERKSNAVKMIRDASRYCPSIEDSVYKNSLWETKSILPRSDSNDSRPILFLPHHGLKNLFVVLGGKIDNIFDIISEVDKLNG